MPPPSSTVVGVEGESLVVTLQANANPMSIIYTWSKDSLIIPTSDVLSDTNADGGIELEQRIYADNSHLNFTKLLRSDAGIYMCEARNSQGSTNLNVTVVVECESI